jgi:hypothetical protein
MLIDIIMENKNKWSSMLKVIIFLNIITNIVIAQFDLFLINNKILTIKILKLIYVYKY